jgi:hypothetical protein
VKKMGIEKTLRKLISVSATESEIARKRLAELLDQIYVCEKLDGNYDLRNKLVMIAAAHALNLGMQAGVRIDPKEPIFPVVFIQLPTGQVSWHVAQHAKEWDGHDTEEKYRRCDEYSRLVHEN